MSSRPSSSLVRASLALCVAASIPGCFLDRSGLLVDGPDGGGVDAAIDGGTMDRDAGDAGRPDTGPPPDGCVVGTETCNGMDDDCDSLVDEELTRDCSSACGAGVETCTDGTFGACSAPPPVTETCNNVDDDCNGAVDDELTQPCTTACGSGVETCTAGVFGGCTAPPVVTEACNNMDDDCDGMIDDGLTRACSTACGSGVETCAAGVYGGCTAPPVVTETCNNMDDDCNGMIDDGLTRSCTTACGTGTETCSAGVYGGCTAPTPGTEACNAIDDNCDGNIDEGGVCPSCVPFTYGGHTYQLCTTQLSFTDATAACAAVGYHLVTIETTAENTAVGTAALTASDDDYWIGLTDAAVEGTWVWVDGNTSTHRDWGAGQPNNAGGGSGQDCAVLTDGTGAGETRGLWNDIGCTSTERFICETP